MRLSRLNACVNSAWIVGANHATAAREAQRLDDAGIFHLPRDLVGVASQREAAEDWAWHARLVHQPPHDALVARRLGGLRRIVRQAERRARLRRDERGAVVHRDDRVERMLLGVCDDGARRRVGIGEADRERHAPLLGKFLRQVQPAHNLDIQLLRRRAERLGAIGARRDEQQQPLAGYCWILRFAHGSPYFAVLESSLEIISHHGAKQRARQQTGSGGGRLTVGWSH